MAGEPVSPDLGGPGLGQDPSGPTAGRIEVRPTELVELSSYLSDAGSRAGALAGSSRSRRRQAAAAGAPRAVAALDEFLSGWATGLDHMSTDLEVLGRLVRRAEGAYLGVDAQVGEDA